MKSFATAGLIGLIAAPGFAGSIAEPVVEPVPVPVMAPPPAVSAWAGPYGGVQMGYGWSDDELEGDGGIGGVHLGYLANSGKFVFGGEVDYDWADYDFDDSHGQMDGVGRLKLIGGYDMGPMLAYATAGAAYGSARIDGSDRDDWGWLAGVGMKYQIDAAWSVGGEILYHQFDDFDDSGYDTDLTTATVRVSYHF
ncbi:MAG: outer membrane protein [Qingshengfaniella sp.]